MERYVHPSATATALTAKVLEAAAELSLPPSKVMVSTEGGYVVVWEWGWRYADMECLNNGDIVSMTEVYNRERDPDIKAVRAGEIKDKVKVIAEWMGGDDSRCGEA